MWGYKCHITGGVYPSIVFCQLLDFKTWWGPAWLTRQPLTIPRLRALSLLVAPPQRLERERENSNTLQPRDVVRDPPNWCVSHRFRCDRDLPASPALPGYPVTLGRGQKAEFMGRPLTQLVTRDSLYHAERQLLVFLLVVVNK